MNTDASEFEISSTSAFCLFQKMFTHQSASLCGEKKERNVLFSKLIKHHIDFHYSNQKESILKG